MHIRWFSHHKGGVNSKLIEKYSYLSRICQKDNLYVYNLISNTHNKGDKSMKRRFNELLEANMDTL